MEKMDSFIRIVNGLKKGLFVAILMLSILFIILGLFLFDPHVFNIETSIGLAVFLSSVVIVISPIYFVLYKIIHYLGALLEKVRDGYLNGKITLLLPSDEYRLLKKYLIIQTLMNLVLEFLDLDRGQSAMREEIFNSLPRADLLAFIGDFYYKLATSSDWIFPNLTASMPLYFLAVIYVVVYLHDENSKLKSELSEVI